MPARSAPSTSKTKTPTKGTSARGRAATKPATKPATKAPATRTRTAATPAKANRSKAAPATKVAAKKPATAAARGGSTRDLNLHGFVPGSDSAIIVDAMVEGGEDRLDVNASAEAAIEKASGLTTRTGGQKNIPSLTAGLLGRLRDRGYTVESTWRLVPPPEVAADIKKEQAANRRKAARSGK